MPAAAPARVLASAIASLSKTGKNSLGRRRMGKSKILVNLIAQPLLNEGSDRPLRRAARVRGLPFFLGGG